MRTLTIIKPDAVSSGKMGKVVGHLEENGFTVVAAQFMHLTSAQAESFYEVHK
jgi:nucleoside-diphosphate kinase